MKQIFYIIVVLITTATAHFNTENKEQKDLKRLSENIYKGSVYEEWLNNIKKIQSEGESITISLKSNVDRSIHVKNKLDEARDDLSKLEEKWDILTNQFWYLDEEDQLETKETLDIYRLEMEKKMNQIEDLAREYKRLKKQFKSYEHHLLNLINGMQSLHEIYGSKFNELQY